MVSATPFNVARDPAFPRRDILAIYAYLNRNHEEVRPNRDPYEHAEGMIQSLAAAARMQ
jgi:hypothetical protein